MKQGSKSAQMLAFVYTQVCVFCLVQQPVLCTWTDVFMKVKKGVLAGDRSFVEVLELSVAAEK